MITMHLPQKDDQILQKDYLIIIDLNITGRTS